MSVSTWVRHDGGRAAAGYKGTTGDCVTRAIAIAADRPYQEVYDCLNTHATRERPRAGHRASNARTGVHRRTYERLLHELGFTWYPTMQVGQGCKVHLAAHELPSGRLVVAVSRHLVAVVDGIAYDTHDPTRGGRRCVYGYYAQPVLLP